MDCLVLTGMSTHDRSTCAILQGEGEYTWGRFALFYMTDSKKVTMTSWYNSIVTFYLRCMVSEITTFYCQPDMTSSSVLRQGALRDHVHDWFWKSDHDFLKAFDSKFLHGMHGFRDNEVLLQAGYDVIMISPPGSVARNFLIADSERTTPIYISVALELNVCRAPFSIFHVFRKWRHSDFVTRGASGNFWLRILKGRPRLYIHVHLTLFVYLERFRRYSTFIYFLGFPY